MRVLQLFFDNRGITSIDYARVVAVTSTHSRYSFCSRRSTRAIHGVEITASLDAVTIQDWPPGFGLFHLFYSLLFLVWCNDCFHYLLRCEHGIFSTNVVSSSRSCSVNEMSMDWMCGFRSLAETKGFYSSMWGPPSLFSEYLSPKGKALPKRDAWALIPFSAAGVAHSLPSNATMAVAS